MALARADDDTLDREADKPVAAVKREKEKAAKKACATGDYQTGVDLLADLYVDTNDVVYVYNQGRCYQQNGRWEQAINRFREYQRKAKNLTASESEETQRQIAECQRALDKVTAATSPTVVSPPATPSNQESMPAAQSQPSADVQGAAPGASPTGESRDKHLRLTGIVVAAVGVAAIGAGVGLTVKAHSLSTADYSRSRESERSTLRTWGIVSYGVGAAAIVTGAVLYVVGWPGPSSSNVAVVPALDPTGASLLLRGRY